MIEKMQGPAQGLLDMLIGKKLDVAQAGEPVSISGEALQQTTEEFTQALAKAQDQKEAQPTAVGNALTKDGSKQALASATTQVAGSIEAKQKAASEKAALVGKTAAKLQAEEKVGVKAQAKSQAQAQTDATTEAQAAIMAQAQAKSLSAEQRSVSDLQGQAKPQGSVGPQSLPMSGGLSALEAREAVISAQEAAMAAQKAALKAEQLASQATDASRMQAASAAAQQTVLQPIVIQMPLAMPVDILEVDMGGEAMAQAHGAMPMIGTAAQGMLKTSSEDFLAERGMVKRNVEAGEINSSEMDRSSKSETSLLIPQVGGHPGANQQFTSAPMVSTEMQVVRTPNGQAEISNMASLAAEVRGLAAKGGGAVRMKVMPESLGEVTIHVQREGAKLNVKFEAASESARDALSSSLAELRTMLVATRHEIGSISVDRVTGAGSLADLGSQQGNDWMSWNNRSDSQDRNGSAWDRYFAEQDAQPQSQWNGGRGHKRYQQWQELGA